MDVVVPQDVALTVERCLVVVLADVVRLRQIIVVGRTVVAIVDGNVVRIAIEERRVGRHIARIFLDRAIDRLNALAVDRQFRLLDGCRVFQLCRRFARQTVVFLHLVSEICERYDRVVGILCGISCLAGTAILDQCIRIRDVQRCRITIDTRKGCLAEFSSLAVDRLVRRIDVVFVVILINRVRCNVDVVRAIIVDVVVPQDVAITVERRLVVVLADVVRLRQIIVVGRTVVAIVDGNVVRIAIEERRVGRHIARIFLDRAIDRLNALAVDRQFRLLDGCRVFQLCRRFARQTVVFLHLVSEICERYDRVVGILCGISCLAGTAILDQCIRIRDVQRCRITIDTRKGCLAEFSSLAVDRLVRRIDVVFVVILINRVRCNVDVVRAIIVDVVVPQDVALTVERCLVVVLADVVRLRQIIAVGFAIVAIIDDNVVLVAIDERRVGRHIARIFFDRAIDRLDALARDREVGRINIDITRSAIFVCYFFYIVIWGTKPRSSNRVRSDIIGITMTFTICRNGDAICIQLKRRPIALYSSFCFDLL